MATLSLIVLEKDNTICILLINVVMCSNLIEKLNVLYIRYLPKFCL